MTKQDTPTAGPVGLREARIGHDRQGNLVVDFEPDHPRGFHVRFTTAQARVFARTLLRRTRLVERYGTDPTQWPEQHQ